MPPASLTSVLIVLQSCLSPSLWRSLKQVVTVRSHMRTPESDRSQWLYCCRHADPE